MFTCPVTRHHLINMARPTASTIIERRAVALRIIGAFGITNLDALPDYERVHKLQGFAAAFRKETGVSYYTSRQYVAFACRRLRGQEVARSNEGTK